MASGENLTFGTLGTWQKPAQALESDGTICWVLTTRLTLTLQHFEIVNTALRQSLRDNNNAIINHAITRNCELTLQLLYTHLNEYLKSILSEMFQKRPLQIVDKAQDTLQFQEILRLGTYEAVCNHMVDRVFRKLQNDRSTRRLIERILARTGANLDCDVLDDAMWYIDIRHLIVHNSGIVDQQFTINYTHKRKYVKEGGKLPINEGMAKKVSARYASCAKISMLN